MKKLFALLLAVVMMLSVAAVAESPFTEENPGSLRVCVYDRSNMNSDYGTVTDNFWTNWIKENFYAATHITIEFVAIPRSGSNTAITTMLAAGNCPDIFFTYDSTMLYDYASQGGLANLEDAIEQYGPLLKEALSEMLPYGYCYNGQYAVPARRSELGHLSSFIRLDWLEKIGYEVKYDNGVAVIPYSDLETILTTWKEEGICEYPMSLLVENTEAESMSPIYLAFIDYDNFTEEDQATLPDIMWPGVKNGFEFLNRLYNNGLIQPDWAQYSDETAWKSWITNGQIGFWAHAYWRELGNTESVMSLYANDPTAKVIACTIANEDGVGAMFDQYAPYGMYIMVPATSEHVNEAIMYLNWQCDPEVFEVLNYGFEGEHYVRNGNIHDSTQKAENFRERISTGDLILVYNGNPDTEVQLAEKFRNCDPLIVDTYKMAYATATYHNYIPYDFGRAINALGEYGSALNEKLSEVYTKSITCSIDSFSDTFDAQIQEYLNMGGQAVIDEKTEAYEDK